MPDINDLINRVGFLNERVSNIEEIVKVNTQLSLEINRHINPGIDPQFYIEVLPINSSETQKFKAVARLRFPETKYFIVKNNSLNIMEVSFTKDIQASNLDIIFPFSQQRYDLKTPYIYMRQRFPSPTTGQVVISEYLEPDPLATPVKPLLTQKKGVLMLQSQTKKGLTTRV